MFWSRPSGGQNDLWVRALDGDGTAESTPFRDTPAAEDYPRISPDGNHVVYVSDESGRNEVYLTRFPGGDGKWQVSVDGGNIPVWSPRGDKIYYREGGSIMEVDVTTEPGLQLGSPRELFNAREIGVNVFGFTRFDVARDGERFLMVQEVREEGRQSSLVLVQNWPAEFEE